MALRPSYRATPREASRRYTLLVLHGIFGSSSNWQTFAKRLANHLSEWQVIAVDLREHGRSQGAPPPHDLDACVADLLELERMLARPFDAVAGHSFGGKVALLYAATRIGAGAPFLYAAVLDADPGAQAEAAAAARPDSAQCLLDLLGSLPARFPARAEFLAALAAHGIGGRVARWLGMNLRAGEGGYRLRMNFASLRALLADYLARDLWPLAMEVARQTPIRFVFGGKSPVAVPELLDRARVAAGRGGSGIRSHVLPRAGHWLHADDLAGLLDVLEADLRALSNLAP
ncbi:MAG: alpha/beta hydrolase [Planctomycetes bacterium]|nr:alpha/beta hydrolase [Planctomycetota bacterium]